VAEFDLSGPLDSTFTLRYRGLDAGAPTTHVLAARVRTFTGFRITQPGGKYDPLFDVYGPEVLRVYAARDPAWCSSPDDSLRATGGTAVACGLAVVDPTGGGAGGTGGLAADPAGGPGFHVPIPIPGTVRGMLAVPSPIIGGLDENGVAWTSTSPAPQLPSVFQVLYRADGSPWVSTLAAVTSSDGNVYLVDLGHGGIANSQAPLADTAARPAQVASVIATTPAVGKALVGLWDSRPDCLAAPCSAFWKPTGATPLSRATLVMPALVKMTPGFTATENWTLRWQGQLPRLAGLRGQLRLDAAAADDSRILWLAIQSASGLPPPGEPLRGVTRLYDPRLAVHARRAPTPGDVAQIVPLDPKCTVFEAEVVALLAPTADYPGGAVGLDTSSVTQPTVIDAQGHSGPADPKCLRDLNSLSLPTTVEATVTFLSGEFVLLGTSTGYAGRPAIQPSAPAAGSYAFALEALAVEPACPMLELGAPWPPASCDDACRDACEQLLLSRKARRHGYVFAQCGTGTVDKVCRDRWMDLTFPNPTGPALAFNLGWVDGDGQPVAAPSRDQVERGTGLSLFTESGLVPVTRVPNSGGRTLGAVLPNGMATFDRAGSTGTAGDGVRVYVAYPGNEVLDFTPSAGPASVGIHQ
jgi:hypothetical protein